MLYPYLCYIRLLYLVPPQHLSAHLWILFDRIRIPTTDHNLRITFVTLLWRTRLPGDSWPSINWSVPGNGFSHPQNAHPIQDHATLVGVVVGSLHWIMIFHICTWQPVPIEIHILFRSVYYRIRIPNIRPRPLIVQWFMWAICYGVIRLPGKHAKYHYYNVPLWKSMVWTMEMMSFKG